MKTLNSALQTLKNGFLLASFLVLISNIVISQEDPNKETTINFDFTKTYTSNDVQLKNITAENLESGLSLTIAPDIESALTIKGDWDLTNWIYVTYTIKNNGKETVRFDPYISGKKQNSKWSKPLWSIGWIQPGETRIFNTLLLPDYSTRKKNYPKMHEDFPNMRGMPDGISFARSFDLKLTNQIQLKFPASQESKSLTLISIQTQNPSKPKKYLEDAASFFPFIDKYGQYKYATWDGKITNDKQLKEEIKKEKKDLASYTGSSEWNEYGGFKNGPKYKATGHFRVEKLDGKWWIVDPSGALFWSSGVNSAGKLGVNTPYKNREHFFDELPKQSDPIYGKFYKNNEYSFGQATIVKKYGSFDQYAYTEKSLERAKSWGLNTFGSWSDENVGKYAEDQRIPYATYVGTLDIKLNEKFPDVFNPKWEKSVRNKIQSKAYKLNKDPYFFGYFVDNEMHWYEPNTMAQKTLMNPAASYGKRALIDILKEELKTIEIFNQKTVSSFKSWDDLLNNRTKLKVENIEEANILFYEKLSHIYFKTIKKAIVELSPGNLYLGCRWHVDGEHRNKYNVPIGAQYLDIISFNQYDNELTDFEYPGKGTFDKPYLISEFNFGALDSGKFYPGLGHASDQRNRGEKYQNFIESGLRDSNCVGAHWFMWGNSTTAGRSVVGENANCGLVSEMDTPFYEMLKYFRATNYNLYSYRLKN
ncbi:MAG: hypothetical protein P8K68_08470 [Algibacter sp.]|uniref:hypothetical protein n=1 Tax=Algibacter sp. TaxID=1872428 RepID=UPI00260B9906|nr:hypothetical protein [Algibacter sp.]MDG1731255.1 hypothetical protein [Algibacter sp.]MDG2178804.1 hypothetical protein [Algibacter sp.]